MNDAVTDPYAAITLENLKAGKLTAARIYVAYCELSGELDAAKGAIERYKALATGASQSAASIRFDNKFQKLMNAYLDAVAKNGDAFKEGDALCAYIDSRTPPAAMPAQASVVPEAVREALRDALSAALGDAMDCTRVWRAWQSGTMDETDFHLIADNDERLDELVDAVLAVAPPAPAPAIQAQPLTDAAEPMLQLLTLHRQFRAQGWRDMFECPIDTEVEFMEFGSTGIHKGTRLKNGDVFLGPDGDFSYPILWRAIDAARLSGATPARGGE